MDPTTTPIELMYSIGLWKEDARQVVDLPSSFSSSILVSSVIRTCDASVRKIELVQHNVNSKVDFNTNDFV